MKGNDDKDNLIMLTAREHFLAHWLLWRIYRNDEMARAFYSMCHFSNKGTQRKERIFSSHAYQEARECYSKLTSKRMRKIVDDKNSKFWMRGKKQTPEHIAKIVEKRKINKSYGKQWSSETREKIVSKIKGISKTSEHIKNQLNSRIKNGTTNKGLILISNKSLVKNKLIKKEDLQAYLNNGWIKGRLKSICLQV
jgi:hypothetical protein